MKRIRIVGRISEAQSAGCKCLAGSRIIERKVMRRKALRFSALHVLLLVAASFWPPPAAAQTYPQKSVRIIAPFPAGGGTDLFARAIAQKLTPAWGQQVVVDNRSGAGGMIGSDLVARAAPDGYTLLITSSSTHAISSTRRFRCKPQGTGLMRSRS